MIVARHWPRDPDYAERVRTSFARQTALGLIGATIRKVTPGAVEIELPYRADLCQQHGFLHGGIITTIVDSACGYAALSLMAPETGVLAVEFKINLLSPGVGERFIARGQVVRSGRTITVCSGEVVALQGDAEKPIALMQATIMAIRGREGIQD